MPFDGSIGTALRRPPRRNRSAGETAGHLAQAFSPQGGGQIGRLVRQFFRRHPVFDVEADLAEAGFIEGRPQLGSCQGTRGATGPVEG